MRDRRCQHLSGCDEPAGNCDVDHIRPYTDGGETSQHNGRLHCGPHNRDHTKRNARPPNPPPADKPEPDDQPDTEANHEDRAPPDAA